MLTDTLFLALRWQTKFRFDKAEIILYFVSWPPGRQFHIHTTEETWPKQQFGSCLYKLRLMTAPVRVPFLMEKQFGLRST